MRLRKYALLIVIFCYPNISLSSSIEAFQTGPLGEGYGYSIISGLQSEATLKTKAEFGKSTFNDIPNEKLSSKTTEHTVLAGTAFRASPEFYMIGYADIKIKSHSQKTRIANSQFDAGANSYEFGSKAIFETERYTFGGGFGLLNIGEEQRNIHTAGVKFSSVASWTIIPQLEFLGGYKWKNTASMIRFKFFSQGDVEVETTNLGKKIIYDKYRKIPAELSLSTLVDLNNKLQIAGELKWLATGQASQLTDEWSNSFTQIGNRVLNGEKKKINAGSVGIGGKFFPTQNLSFATAIHYSTPQFSKPSTASLEDGGFGGFKISFASEFIKDAATKIHAETSYLLPKSISTVKSADPDDVSSHQSITTGNGSRTKTTLAVFNLSLGSTIMF